MNKKVLVVFSGGQDSTTCLGYAIKKYGVDNIFCVSFQYGQKHSIELEQGKKILSLFPSIKHQIVDISFLSQIVKSELTSKDGDFTKNHSRLSNLPSSFVPCRNQIFLTIAHAIAQENECSIIITGVCQTDYSGYPDCRDDFIKALQVTTNLGYQSNIIIETPLMWLTKSETFALAKECGFLDIVIEHSHTCYNGNREIKHDWGFGCGECPACELRKKGWLEYCGEIKNK